MSDFEPTLKSPFEWLTDEEWESQVQEEIARFRSDRDFMRQISAEKGVIAFGIDNYIRRVAERCLDDMYSLPFTCDKSASKSGGHA